MIGLVFIGMLVAGAALGGAVGAAFGVWVRRRGRPFTSEARAGGLRND